MCCLHHSLFRIFWIDELVQNNCKVVAHELQIQDVKLASVNFVQISLKHSKTDQLGEGIVISLFITSQPICPVESLTFYMRVRHVYVVPFFVMLKVQQSLDIRFQQFFLFSMLITK